MYTYTIKWVNSQYLLVKRFDGVLLYTTIVPEHIATKLILDGIIENEHVLLHYSKQDDEELNRMLL